jgi:uncharacterized membrane protein YhhN
MAAGDTLTLNYGAAPAADLGDRRLLFVAELPFLVAAPGFQLLHRELVRGFGAFFVGHRSFSILPFEIRHRKER